MIIVMIVIAQYKQNGVAVSGGRWFYCCYVMLSCFVFAGGILYTFNIYLSRFLLQRNFFLLLLVCMSECTHVSLNVLLCMSEISALSAAVLCMFNFFLLPFARRIKWGAIPESGAVFQTSGS